MLKELPKVGQWLVFTKDLCLRYGIQSTSNLPRRVVGYCDRQPRQQENLSSILAELKPFPTQEKPVKNLIVEYASGNLAFYSLDHNNLLEDLSRSYTLYPIEDIILSKLLKE